MIKRIHLFILAVLIGTWFFGCATADSDAYTTEPLPDSNALFEQAVTPYLDATEYALAFEVTQTVTVGSQVFTEVSKGTIQYQGYLVQVEKEISIDPHTIQVSEIFQEDTLYLSVNDSRFCGAVGSVPAIPVILLDKSLYETSQVSRTENGYAITLESATAPESWALPQNGVFINAVGTLETDKEGQLLSCTYSLEYSINGIQKTLSVKATPSIADLAEITLPEKDSFTALEAVYGPLYLEKACGFLMQASNITAKTTDSILCQAGNFSRTQTVELATSGLQDEMETALTTSVDLTDLSRQLTSSTYTQTETFHDGVYQISTNGSEPVTQEDIGWEQMRATYQNTLISTLPLPEHIAGASASTDGNVLTLKFTGNNDLGIFICQNSCQTLYQDPDAFHSVADECAMEKMDCYLTIDLNTGLPISAGLEHITVHTANELPYSLTTQCDQTFSLYSNT